MRNLWFVGLDNKIVIFLKQLIIEISDNDNRLLHPHSAVKMQLRLWVLPVKCHIYYLFDVDYDVHNL